MSRELEGGTSASIKDAVYGARIIEQQRGCAGLHRGQLVSIKGEPGMHVYKVLAVDPVRREAVIARVGSTTETWRLPASALAAFD